MSTEEEVHKFSEIKDGIEKLYNRLRLEMEPMRGVISEEAKGHLVTLGSGLVLAINLAIAEVKDKKDTDLDKMVDAVRALLEMIYLLGWRDRMPTDVTKNEQQVREALSAMEDMYSEEAETAGEKVCTMMAVNIDNLRWTLGMTPRFGYPLDDTIKVYKQRREQGQ